MPEQLTKEEVAKGQDPSVAKQWDDETDVETKFKDFYSIADGLKVCIRQPLCIRHPRGPVGFRLTMADWHDGYLPQWRRSEFLSGSSHKN